MKTRVWIPVILFKDKNGRLRYETHGTFDNMVSNKRKRKDCEGDFWSCFTLGGETPEGWKEGSDKLVWLHAEIEYPAKDKTIKLVKA